jgi:hypothetical protein
VQDEQRNSTFWARTLLNYLEFAGDSIGQNDISNLSKISESDISKIKKFDGHKSTEKGEKTHRQKCDAVLDAFGELLAKIGDEDYARWRPFYSAFAILFPDLSNERRAGGKNLWDHSPATLSKLAEIITDPEIQAFRLPMKSDRAVVEPAMRLLRGLWILVRPESWSPATSGGKGAKEQELDYSISLLNIIPEKLAPNRGPFFKIKQGGRNGEKNKPTIFGVISFSEGRVVMAGRKQVPERFFALVAPYEPQVNDPSAVHEEVLKGVMLGINSRNDHVVCPVACVFVPKTDLLEGDAFKDVHDALLKELNTKPASATFAFIKKYVPDFSKDDWSDIQALWAPQRIYLDRAN